tara:strand:- start:3579 stop:3914 length:336 start_codon:yes stop_codon:yes gene_type:complete
MSIAIKEVFGEYIGDKIYKIIHLRKMNNLNGEFKGDYGYDELNNFMNIKTRQFINWRNLEIMRWVKSTENYRSRYEQGFPIIKFTKNYAEYRILGILDMNDIKTGDLPSNY